MTEKREVPSRAEQKERAEKPVVQVAIDMARHSKKASETQEGRVPLSEAGILAAIEKGVGGEYEDVIKQRAAEGKVLSAYGSPRERTVQSSVFRMFGDQFKNATFKDVDPQQVVEWLEKSDGFESELTPLLNFAEGEGEYTAEMHTAFEGGTYLTWLTEKSDQAAIDYKQDPENVTPLSIQAGNVATFIWALGLYKTAKLLEGKDEEKIDVAFATSHQGVLESLLYKVVKMKEGDQAAKDLIEELDNQGFAENQGYGVVFNTYDEAGKDWDVSLIYNKRKFVLTPEELTQIMQEGIDLKDKLKK